MTTDEEMDRYLRDLVDSAMHAQTGSTTRLGRPQRPATPRGVCQHTQSFLDALTGDREIAAWLLIICGVIFGAVAYLDSHTDDQVGALLLAFAIGALIWRVLGSERTRQQD